jgi:hypothetical protein
MVKSVASANVILGFLRRDSGSNILIVKKISDASGARARVVGKWTRSLFGTHAMGSGGTASWRPNTKRFVTGELRGVGDLAVIPG